MALATTTGAALMARNVDRGADQNLPVVRGTTTVRFSPEHMEVFSAIPEPGFDADIEGQDDGRIRSEFESDRRESRLDVWWGGGMRHHVHEGAGDEHDD